MTDDATTRTYSILSYPPHLSILLLLLNTLHLFKLVLCVFSYIHTFSFFLPLRAYSSITMIALQSNTLPPPLVSPSSSFSSPSLPPLCPALLNLRRHLKMDSPLIVVRVACAANDYINSISDNVPMLIKDRHNPSRWTAADKWSHHLEGDLPIDVVDSNCTTLFVIVPDTPVHDLPKPHLADIEEIVTTIRYIDQELHDIQVIVLIDGSAHDDLVAYWQDIMFARVFHSTLSNMFLCQLAKLGRCSWAGTASIYRKPDKFLSGLHVRHRVAPDLPKHCELVAIGARPSPTQLLSMRSGYFLSLSHLADRFTTAVLQGLCHRNLTFVLCFDHDDDEEQQHLFCYWTDRRCQAILLQRPDPQLTRQMDVANYRLRNMGVMGRASVTKPPSSLQLPLISPDGVIIHNGNPPANTESPTLTFEESIDYLSGKPIPEEKKRLVRPVLSVKETSELELRAFMERAVELQSQSQPGSTAPVPSTATPAVAFLDTPSCLTNLSRQKRSNLRSQAARRERFRRLQSNSIQKRGDGADNYKRLGSIDDARHGSRSQLARKRARHERSYACDALSLTPSQVNNLILPNVRRLSASGPLFDDNNSIGHESGFSWKKDGDPMCIQSASKGHLLQPISDSDSIEGRSKRIVHGVEFARDEDVVDAAIKSIESNISYSTLEFAFFDDMSLEKFIQLQVRGAFLQKASNSVDFDKWDARAKEMNEIMRFLEKAGFSRSEWSTFQRACRMLLNKRSFRNSG